MQSKVGMAIVLIMQCVARGQADVSSSSRETVSIEGRGFLVSTILHSPTSCALCRKESFSISSAFISYFIKYGHMFLRELNCSFNKRNNDQNDKCDS